MTRSRRGVRPTPAGQAMLEPLRGLVAAEEAVRESALESGGAYVGRVHIGGVSVTAETVIAPVVGQLREHRPGLRFAVREGSSTDIEAAVLSAPVGVLARTDHPLAGRDHVDWHELQSWPIVTMRAGTVLWELLHRYVTRPDIVVQAMSARTLKVMVREGAGLGLLARFETSADIPDVVWLPLRDADPVRLCLTQRQDSQPSRSALIVRQLIRARADELTGHRHRTA